MDTIITIKVSVNDNLKKLKLPLRDLGANVLPDKVCSITPCFHECSEASSLAGFTEELFHHWHI